MFQICSKKSYQGSRLRISNIWKLSSEISIFGLILIKACNGDSDKNIGCWEMMGTGEWRSLIEGPVQAAITLGSLNNLYFISKHHAILLPYLENLTFIGKIFPVDRCYNCYLACFRRWRKNAAGKKRPLSMSHVTKGWNIAYEITPCVKKGQRKTRTSPIL